ncbi:MAG: arginine--tRNA ligase [Candidatus Heimdallarchaeaceae archaeon]
MVSLITESIKNLLIQAIKKEFSLSLSEIVLKKPTKDAFGDLSFPMFSIAKELKLTFDKIAEKLNSYLSKHPLIEKTEVKGGFLNLFFNREEYARQLLSSILKGNYFENMKVFKNERIIIEHTSSNPNGPLHIGNFRGSVIGDVLARIFRELGAAVNVRYYVNDLGKQIAPLVIGYELLKDLDIKPDCKIDLWIGKIYATMNTLLEIQQMKLKLEKKYDNWKIESSNYEISEVELSDFQDLVSTNQNVKEFQVDLDRLRKLFNVQNSLKRKIPDIYITLRDEIIKKKIDLSDEARYHVQCYQEACDDVVVKKFREVTENTLKGHIETLQRFRIFHDAFDWESDIAWSGEVTKILEKLEEGKWLRHDGKARLLQNDLIASKLGYKSKHKIKYEIPETILVNSDGITLYPCRDIAYHLHKLEKFSANRCYNIIGKQQQLPQLAVRLALYALGLKELAESIIHVDYEYVTLIGRKMAGRELEYVTPDELFNLATQEILKVMEDRNYPEEEKEKIAQKVATSSIKYFILKTDRQKAVAFDVKKAINPDENTGPFLQYSYARAYNILTKGKEEGINVEEYISNIERAALSVTSGEWTLILTLDDYMGTLLHAANSLRPEVVANYAFQLASVFHKFYDTCPVLKAETEEKRATRILLVSAYTKIFDNLFEVLGVEKLEKM